MSAPLCFDFLRHADWVWRRIALADQIGFQFGEETITDQILMELAIGHPNRLFIQPFNKIEEGKNGADWEWWLGRDGNWIGMRVQAKRIDLPRERFNELFYQSPKSKEPQIEKLIEQAAQASLAPIYVLYTHSENELSLKSEVQHCAANHSGPFHECGCLVAHARDLVMRGSKMLSDVAPLCFPWHWLVCHCMIGGDGGDGPADFIANLLARSGDDLVTEEDRRIERFVPKPQETLPDYIAAPQYEDGGGKREEVLNKHCRKWDLGGVAVFDLGEGEE